MNKVLILNYTENWCHFGCTGTSRHLKQRFGVLGDVETVGIEKTTKLAPGLVKVDDLLDAGFFADWIKNNEWLMEKMAGADHIIVNGEGTLHGAAASAKTLLYIIWVATNYLKKTVQVVNHSVFPYINEIQGFSIFGGIESIYREVYAKVARIEVREPLSKAYLKLLDQPSVLEMDGLHYSAQDWANAPATLEDSAEKAFPKPIIVAGSVMWGSDGIAGTIAELVTRLQSQGHGVICLTGAQGHESVSCKLFREDMSKHTRAEMLRAESLEEWLSAILGAKLVISGRFHHSVAANALGTPYLNFQTNTPKLHGLAMVTGAPEPIFTTDKMFEEKMADEIDKVFS